MMCLNYVKGFCVGIELMRVLSSSELVQTLRAKCYKSPEVSRALGNYYFIS